ncbi:hypothetical protein HPB47_006150 [Ixodes persulcatus]|uniref:Uncharacterized protein n=1 Tax=Ixodes persulcatus TaxID=34615 RepID=A0AC60PB16_IXOPE|nr:hypothetical protein HPB47_006150 [Ixodes persulcatus]
MGAGEATFLARIFPCSTPPPLHPIRRKFLKDDYPPVYPNGWFPILESEDLHVEQVKRVDVLGLELVAFRTKDGTAHVMDAHCPHLGAHLGVMGRIVDGCIECPFHGWRFDSSNGVCKHVPYAAKVPEFVKLKTWQTEELLGHIFLWFHADGEEPSWKLEDVPQITNGEWKMFRRYEEKLTCHIRDLAENESDLTHFRYFHGPNLFVSMEEFSKNAGDTKWGRFLTHIWTPKWYTVDHKCNVDIDADVLVLGRCPAFLKNRTYLTMHGPGLLMVRLECKFGTQVTVVSVTPEEPFQVRVVHRIHFEPNTTWLFRCLSSKGYVNSFERDMLFWNHKAMQTNPPWQKDDRTVIEFRKWYSQFFSASSPTWRDMRDRTYEW